MDSNLYDRDFYAWANEQAALLRSGKLDQADIANIVEEIESMGRSEKRELVNRLVVLMLHLLKWRYQPGMRGNNWRLTVEEQHIRLSEHISDNPSLKTHLGEAQSTAYRLALIEAERETGLSRRQFPESCPWTFQQMLDDCFWPEG